MKVIKTVGMISCAFLMMSTIVGCGMSRGAQDQPGKPMQQRSIDSQTLESNQAQRERLNGNSYGTDHPRPDMAHQPRMIVSQDIADAVTQLDGVEMASVMLTDRNAYVAVVMEERRPGRTDDLNGTDMTRQNSGNHRERLNGTRANRTEAPNDAIGNDRGGRMNNSGNDSNDRTLNDNLMDELDVNDEMKENIANTVREMNPNVENVYVSSNPDFVDRFNGIMDHMANGRPLSGLINEFNVLVERIFPESR